MAERELKVELDKLQITSNPRNVSGTDCVFTLDNNPFFNSGLLFEFNKRENQDCSDSKQNPVEGKSCQPSVKITKCAIYSKQDDKYGVRRPQLKKVTKQRLLLRDPILKVLKNCQPTQDVSDSSTTSECSCNSILNFSNNLNDFRDLVDSRQTLRGINYRFNCPHFDGNQGKIFDKRQKDHSTKAEAPLNEEFLSRKPNLSLNLQEQSSNHRSSTCSQQAIGTSVSDDVTIDELASYFDNFVHIPKKMSSMAEMMYI